MMEDLNLMMLINKLVKVNHEQKQSFYKMYPLNEMEDDCLKVKINKDFQKENLEKPKAFLRLDDGGESINSCASINKGTSKIEFDCLSRK
jgi:hypothetical protein